MGEETTFRKLKKGLLELLRGYPGYRFFGKIEFYLKNRQSSIQVLDNDGVIELASKKEEEALNKKLTSEQILLFKKEGKEKPDCWYRLAPKGIDLAISMINMENSEKSLKFSNKILSASIIMVCVSIFSLIVAILSLLENRIFVLWILLIIVIFLEVVILFKIIPLLWPNKD